MCVGMLHCYVCIGGDLRWWVGWLVCRPGLPILLGLLLVVVLKIDKRGYKRIDLHTKNDTPDTYPGGVRKL